MLAAAPDAEASFVADAGYESVTFLLPPDEIHAHLKARQREGEFRLPLGVETLQVDGDNARRLFAWGKRLVDAAARQPALFNERETERIAAHVELVELLLAILGGALDYEPSRSDRTRQAQSLVVKVAEDYALSQISDHLYVSDLCRVAAVSERTLEYAFKEVMGLTPVTYLIRLRLHRVRRALLASTQGSTRCRPRHSTGASGTSANSRAPTRTASTNCRRTHCDESRESCRRKPRRRRCADGARAICRASAKVPVQRTGGGVLFGQRCSLCIN